MKKNIIFFILFFVLLGQNISYALTDSWDASVTDDPYSRYQYYFEKMRIGNVWKDIYLFNRKKVIVAIIDDGIYQNHEDLAGNLWLNADEIVGNGKDDDNNGYVDDNLGYNFLNKTNDVTQTGEHGTAVAGIIGANKNNKIGVAGITQYATLMPLIACNDDGCSRSAIIEAIYYAVNNGARIINLSLSSMLTNGFSTDFNDAIQYAYDNNVAIIASAGNGDPNGGTGYDLDKIPQSPVCNDGGKNMVLGVGASTEVDNFRTSWTNYGSCVDVYAPGENITSTLAPTSTNSYLYTKGLDGTSFSSPIVTGIAVEALSSYGDISNEALYNYLINASINGLTRGDVDAYTFVSNIVKVHSDPSYKGQDNFTGQKIYKNPYVAIIQPQGPVISQSVFTDVPVSSTFYDAIKYLKDKNIVSGYSDGTYKPYNSINRAEFTKIIIGSLSTTGLGVDCFSDVHTEWFAPYVCYAKANYIIGGYKDGTFKPNQNINLVESLKIVLLALKVPLSGNIGTNWFDVYVNTAIEKNLLALINPSLAHEVTRGEMAQLIYNIKK